MKPVSPIVTLSLLAACGLVGCHPSQVQMTSLPGTSHPIYTITDLGVGLPSGINNRGQVVGEYAAGVLPNSQGRPYFHGCLWSKGKPVEMPTLGGWYSNAVNISNDGRVIGTATAPVGAPLGKAISKLHVQHLCLWDGSKLTDLDVDSRFHGISAVHITKFGAIYAASPPQGPKKQFHLWFYPAGFGPCVRRDVGVIGGDELRPTAINDSGVVVGTWDTGEVRNKQSLHHAFVWHVGDMRWTDIGTFGGSESEPAGINDKGQVVGTADLPDDETTHQFRSHAFVWEEGRLKDLGALPGGNFSHAYAINNRGQIVGFSLMDGNGIDARPVLWDHGQIKDLSRLIPSGALWGNIGGAAGINDKGQIVGDESVINPRDDHAHGYLLTPI